MELNPIFWVINDVIGYNEPYILLLMVIVDLLDVYTRLDNLTTASVRLNPCNHTSGIPRSWPPFKAYPVIRY